MELFHQIWYGCDMSPPRLRPRPRHSCSAAQSDLTAAFCTHLMRHSFIRSALSHRWHQHVDPSIVGIATIGHLATRFRPPLTHSQDLSQPPSDAWPVSPSSAILSRRRFPSPSSDVLACRFLCLSLGEEGQLLANKRLLSAIASTMASARSLEIHDRIWA